MKITDHPHAETGPRQPRMDRDVAMRLAETEYQRSLDLMRSLSPEDWTKPTDCPAWDVRAMAGHTVGMALMATGLKETLRQSLLAKRQEGPPLDALTALQVKEHAHLSTSELIDRFAQVGPRAARGRRRTPALVRRMKLPDPAGRPGTSRCSHPSTTVDWLQMSSMNGQAGAGAQTSSISPARPGAASHTALTDPS